MPDFWFEIFGERMLGPFEQVSDFVVSTEKVEGLSNGNRIKFELDKIFAPLPYDFSFFSQKVESYRNRLKTSTADFCSTLIARHSLDICRVNVGQRSKPFERAIRSSCVFY